MNALTTTKATEIIENIRFYAQRDGYIHPTIERYMKLALAAESSESTIGTIGIACALKADLYQIKSANWLFDGIQIPDGYDLRDVILVHANQAERTIEYFEPLLTSAKWQADTAYFERVLAQSREILAADQKALEILAATGQ